jgi:hypothetical protein
MEEQAFDATRGNCPVFFSGIFPPFRIQPLLKSLSVRGKTLAQGRMDEVPVCAPNVHHRPVSI